MLLAQPLKIAKLELRNRFVMAPMHTNAADDGFVSDWQIEHYRRRAEGGTALVIVEAAMVSPKSVTITPGRQAGTRSLAIYDDRFIPRLAELAEKIKRGGAKAALQLADTRLVSRGVTPTELSSAEVEEIINDFIQAACRVKYAGFDAVEFHMAHRYTLADFLSQRANKRNDDFGKDIVGRCRVSESIVKGTKAIAGEDFPVICRINGDEFQNGGNTLVHARIIARRLVRAGANIIHVSAGGRIEDGGNRSYSCLRQNPGREFPDGTNVYLAEEIKKSVPVPVIAVGKIRTPELAEEILRSDKADLIALARPLLADPDYPRKAMEGRSKEIKRCLACNDCLRLVFRDGRAECTRGALSINKKGERI